MTSLQRTGGFALLSMLAIGCVGSQPQTASPTSSPSAAQPSTGGPSGPFDPTGLSVSLEPVVGGLDAPLGAVTANDDSGRIFVVEKGGLVRIIRDGHLVSEPFLDISGSVSGGSEQGLLGLAFHPDYPEDPRFFVNYTDTDGDTRVSSFTVDGTNPDQADQASEVQVLFVDQPYGNHNGGAVVFGPDGYLYIGLGDGGSGGDPHFNGQKLGTMLGKILRIDVDRPVADQGYGVPDDNPFVDRQSALPEILQFGLRNPWRLSFDRETGDLWIGDVGQNQWEEIDVARAGAKGLNYGWNRMEGAHCFRPSEGCDQTRLTLPVAEYSHGGGIGRRCTVIGGYVYRGSAQPALAGGYLFADYCSGTIWAIDPTSDQPREPTVVSESKATISSFGEDEAGELYLTDLSSGQLLRIVATRS